MGDQRSLYIGMILTLAGGILWGLSGTCVQFIQHTQHFNSEWLVTFRLLTAGVITFFLTWLKEGNAMFRVCKHPADLVRVGVFGVLGVALCQYSYFRSIYYSGAGIATVLQYLAPALIILYMAIRYRKKPTVGELISVVLATFGTAVIALRGEMSLASINGHMLFWGLLSAVAVGIYSAQPVQLLRAYGTGPVLSLAMVFGGMVTYGIWQPRGWGGGIWDMWTVAALFGIIILGTVVSFTAYLEGVRRIGAVKGTILSSIEPISAAIFGWAVLGNEFSIPDVIGFCCILSTIFILAYDKQNR